MRIYLIPNQEQEKIKYLPNCPCKQLQIEHGQLWFPQKRRQTHGQYESRIQQKYQWPKEKKKNLDNYDF